MMKYKRMSFMKVHILVILFIGCQYLSAQHWQSVGPAPGPNFNCINAISTYKGDIIIGGDFEKPLSEFDRVARWNGHTWDSLGKGLKDRFLTISGSSVHSFTNYHDTLIAGGCFSDSGLSYLVRWADPDWSHFHDSVGSSGCVYAFYQSGDSLFLGGGGAFGKINNIYGYTHGITFFQGGKLHPLGDGLVTSGSIALRVSAITTHGNTVYAGGEFEIFPSIDPVYVASWDGSSWQRLGEGLNGPVYALAVYHDTLFAGGYFTEASGKSATGIAYWDGQFWHPAPNENLITHSRIHAMAIYRDKLYMGGNFAGYIGTDSASGLLVYDGHKWTAPNIIDGTINALKVINDTLYAGGCFYQVDSIPIGHLGALSYGPLANLDEPSLNAKIKLWPNPVKDQLNLSINQFKGYEIQITLINLMGETVFHKPYAEGTSITINIDNLPPGSYLCMIEGLGIRLSRRFIKV